MEAMYSTFCKCLVAVLHSRSYFAVRTGHIFCHLAADGAGFLGGQMTVVAIGQVDTDLLGLISILKQAIASRAWGMLIWLFLLLLILVLTFDRFPER